MDKDTCDDIRYNAEPSAQDNLRCVVPSRRMSEREREGERVKGREIEKERRSLVFMLWKQMPSGHRVRSNVVPLHVQ